MSRRTIGYNFCVEKNGAVGIQTPRSWSGLIARVANFVGKDSILE
jgi:hypothetical protein